MKSKRILAALLCFCLAASANAAAMQGTITAQADDAFVELNPEGSYGDFRYALHFEGGYAEITGFNTMAEGEVTVPDDIYGYPVKVIGEHGLVGGKITSVTLPDTVTEIGKQAFYNCAALESVNLPDSVTAIGEEAFINCVKLQLTVLPENLETIGARAFYGCRALTSITIPDSVTEIGESAFDSCTSLAEVQLSTSITKLADGVFNNTALTALDVPWNVMSIGLWAIPSKLEKLTIHNPECTIAVSTIPTLSQNCVIAAPWGSAAQDFAEEWGYTFEVLESDVPPPGPVVIAGDIDGNWELNLTDVVLLQKWILGVGSEKIVSLSNADLNGDGEVDVFDLALVKKELFRITERDPNQDYTDAPTYTAKELSKGIDVDFVVGKEADDAFVLGQTAFALSLLQNTVADENIFISPYSVVQALGMTANGAEGQTKTEMEQVIGGMSMEKLNPYIYTQRMNQPDSEKCKLTTANSIWFKDSIEVKQDFLQTNADYYGADAFSAPFDTTTVDDINKWINTRTDGMIPELLKEIPEKAVMYLVDAVAFDAKWKQPYETENQLGTRKFTAYDGTVQTAELMYSDEYYYLEDAHAAGFLKYYEGDRYAFAALMPEEGLSVTDYIAGLTPEGLHETLANPERTSVYAGLPKFSYDYDIELSDPLKTMGMPTAFDKIEADLSGIADLDGEFFISRVLHKTHIDVFEEGTKAAAVTGVEASADAMPDHVLILDRPFVYCIVDTETALPVFIGALMEIPE